VRDMWQLLMDNGVEIVVSGHDHFYERFAPQDADYKANTKGIRQLIAGSGGASLYRPATRAANTETIIEAFGVLKLTLEPTGYLSGNSSKPRAAQRQTADQTSAIELIPCGSTGELLNQLAGRKYSTIPAPIAATRKPT
jgi:hypothetical protein